MSAKMSMMTVANVQSLRDVHDSFGEVVSTSVDKKFWQQLQSALLVKRTYVPCLMSIRSFFMYCPPIQKLFREGTLPLSLMLHVFAFFKEDVDKD